MYRDLVDLGVQTIKCVDYSYELIKKLQDKNLAKYGELVEFYCLDCRNLTGFPDLAFDTIFDKGTLDCILVKKELYSVLILQKNMLVNI